MKFSWTLIFLIFLGACSNGAKTKTKSQIKSNLINDLSDYSLKGKIKSVNVKTYECSFKGGKIEPGEPSINNPEYRLEFDEKNRLMRLFEYLGKAREIDTVTWTVSRDNEGMKSALTGFSKSNTFRGKYIYVNSESGKLIQTKTYNRDSILTEVVNHSYDTLDRCYESKIENSKGILQGKINYTFDTQNRIFRIVEQTKNRPDRFTQMGYNSEGFIAQSENKFGNQVTQYRFVYVYDQNGNYTQKTTYINDKPVEIELRNITYY